MKARNESKEAVNVPSGAKVAVIYVAISVAAMLASSNSVLSAMLSVTLLYGVYAYCKHDKQTAKALYKTALKIKCKLSK